VEISLACAESNASRNAKNTSCRPPRVSVTWQRRIAAFFGQELS
jgi:hypothetical protein